jgi:hypothetical protein
MRKFAIGISSVVCLVAVFAYSRVSKREPEKQRPARVSSVAAKTSVQKPAGSVAAQYGRTPLAFEENHGQASPEAKFLARGAGYEIFLTPQESVFVLKAPSAVNASKIKSPKFASKSSASILRMKLLGANFAPVLTSEDQLPGVTNYLLGKNPANWRTNIPNYRRVKEHGAYPGIDLVYYGTQGQLEYDFVVAAHQDPSVIRFSVQGADKLSTSSDGDLLVSIRGGQLKFHKPYAYQQNGQAKETVAANYVLEANNTVAFKLGNYDSQRALVIDPILSYSTYLGGSDIDGANAIAVAPDNTAFIAGGTFSIDFPTAGTHPLQINHGGPDDFSKDAFVAKLSVDGSTVLYATFLGGSKQDEAHGIAVDNFGNAYVIGTTLSVDFPTTPGTFGTICGADNKCGASFNPGGLVVSNGFLAKLNPAGSALIYSEYIGYYENVEGLAVAVDSDQNAYITGQTSANIAPTVVITPPNTPPPPFPITASAFQPAFGGGATDAFIMKISASGLSILYSSYLGGSNEDDAYGIAVDASHNAYLTGLTYSPDFILKNPVQGASGGAGDAWVAKVNTGLSGAASLLFSSYLGGTGLDQGNGIAVDTAGNAYVTGATNSAGLATSGVLQNTNAGLGDAFVAKYSTALASPALVYFTYLGGTKADSGAGIAVDGDMNVYVAGSTVSTNFATTPDAFQRTYGGGNADAFVAKLDPLGATLLYSSFLGGTNTESGNGIAIDTNDPPGAYVAGQTCSQDFPLSNPAQASSGGNCDAFVSKIGVLEGIAITPTGLVFAPQTLGSTSDAQTVTITSGVAPVSITSISVAGANPGDFAILNNTCGASLPANSQCTVSVTFTPSASGNRTGTLSIVDSVSGQPSQSIVASLSGSASTVPDFSVATTLPTATVSAGQSATFTLQVTGVNGYAQPVNLACQGLPAGASCAFSPNPVTPSGASTPVTVTIFTAVRNLVPPSFRINYPHGGSYQVLLAFLIAFLLLALVARHKQISHRPVLAGFGLVALMLLAAAGCGGGNSTGVPAGTQAGTYTVTVVATSGSLTHKTTLTLQVK